ncbi:DUF1761 domain-containing protein [Jhaorihella thermophila]
MEILNVLAATAAAWVLGALWYGALSGPWVRAAGVACDENGRPKGGQSPVLFVASFVLQLFVAGMMRHVFAMSGIDTVIGGLMGGGRNRAVLHRPVDCSEQHVWATAGRADGNRRRLCHPGLRGDGGVVLALF